jgi:proliferating cell nuclear antigen
MTEFKLRFEQAKLFSEYFKTLNVIMDELTFYTRPDGITFRGMDPSRVAMLDVDFPQSIFSEYQQGEKVDFAVNLDTLAKLLKLADDTDSVELNLLPNDKLAVIFKGKSTRKFTMSILGDPAEKVPPPKITFYAKTILQTKQFLQFLNNISTLSDHFVLIATPEQLSFLGEGNTTKAEITLEKKDLALLECKDERQRAVFSITYMTEALKAMSEVCESVTVEWCDDMPIKVDFKLPHAGKIWWFLAPRIEIE